jgi:hypothetical protein
MKVTRSGVCSEDEAVFTGIEGMYLKLGKSKAEAAVEEVIEGAMEVAVVRTLLNGFDVLGRDSIIVRCVEGIRIHQGKVRHDLIDVSFRAEGFPTLGSRHLHRCDLSSPAVPYRRGAAVYRRPLSRLMLVHGQSVNPLAWRAWLDSRNLAQGMILSQEMEVGYPGARAFCYCALGWWKEGVCGMPVRSSRA